MIKFKFKLKSTGYIRCQATIVGIPFAALVVHINAEHYMCIIQKSGLIPKQLQFEMEDAVDYFTIDKHLGVRGWV
ncbi:hypothetical protein SAMN02910358_01749 [Lachnospiraceae bacterium XBB1006]|nr:hypothetical protein SAMN02910358_01749 [Lachnospiraceae bacterium XBB1006]